MLLQAIMSILQFGEYISWKVPKKCHILCSSNPDNGEYNVTGLDPAVMSRMINFNVDFDVQIWSKWADTMGIRSEMINFALLTPEMFERSKAINARSYTMFANACSGIKDLDTDESLEKVCLISKGCFNDDWVSGMFIQFVHNKLDKLIDAKEMLQDDWTKVKNKLIDNIYRNNTYDASIASTLTLRFNNYIENYFETPDVDKNKSEKVVNRLIDLCTSDKMLFSEDLLYKLIKHLNAKFPTRCSKFFKYPQIRQKLM